MQAVESLVAARGSLWKLPRKRLENSNQRTAGGSGSPLGFPQFPPPLTRPGSRARGEQPPARSLPPGCSAGRMRYADADPESPDAGGGIACSYDCKVVCAKHVPTAVRRSCLPVCRVALKYKQLWVVGGMSRSVKSLLDTRPIHRKCGDTIRGHVFCSFLALMLRKELQGRLGERAWAVERADVTQDPHSLQGIELDKQGKRFVLRTEAQGALARSAGRRRGASPTVRKVGP